MQATILIPINKPVIGVSISTKKSFVKLMKLNCVFKIKAFPNNLCYSRSEIYIFSGLGCGVGGGETYFSFPTLLPHWLLCEL